MSRWFQREGLAELSRTPSHFNRLPLAIISLAPINFNWMSKSVRVNWSVIEIMLCHRVCREAPNEGVRAAWCVPLFSQNNCTTVELNVFEWVPGSHWLDVKFKKLLFISMNFPAKEWTCWSLMLPSLRLLALIFGCRNKCHRVLITWSESEFVFRFLIGCHQSQIKKTWFCSIRFLF